MGIRRRLATPGDHPHPWQWRSPSGHRTPSLCGQILFDTGLPLLTLLSSSFCVIQGHSFGDVTEDHHIPRGQPLRDRLPTARTRIPCFQNLHYNQPFLVPALCGMAEPLAVTKTNGSAYPADKKEMGWEMKSPRKGRAVISRLIQGQPSGCLLLSRWGSKPCGPFCRTSLRSSRVAVPLSGHTPHWQCCRH